MQKHLAWLPVTGLFGVLATANAQTPPAAAGGGSYDGNYRLVSSANVDTTYTTRKGQTAPCPSRRAGPLHIGEGTRRSESGALTVTAPDAKAMPLASSAA